MKNHLPIAVFATLWLVGGCNSADRASSAEPAVSEKAIGVSPSTNSDSGTNNFVRASDSVIHQRYRDAVESETADHTFEATARTELEERFPNAFVGAIRCSTSSCYVDASFDDAESFRDFRPRYLNWGTSGYLSRDEEALSVFAVISRGDADLPTIDLAE